MLEALRVILRRHDPCGAVALDRNWDIVMASEAYAALVNASPLPPIDGRQPAPIVPLTLTTAPRPNLLRLLCHPAGYRRHLVNWEEVVGAVLFRVEQEVARARSDPKRRALLAEVFSYPGVPKPGLGSGIGTNAALVIPVELSNPAGSTIRLLSTIATLGTAEDITLRELRIEAFYPADEPAEQWARERAGDRP
jgi:hypothetical protein